MELYIGEFNESDIQLNTAWYQQSLANAKEKNPDYTGVRTELVEYRGRSYYFRKMKVWLTK